MRASVSTRIPHKTHQHVNCTTHDVWFSNRCCHIVMVAVQKCSIFNPTSRDMASATDATPQPLPSYMRAKDEVLNVSEQGMHAFAMS